MAKAKAKGVTVPLMYHGERVYYNGKVYQIFKDRKGEKFNWSGIKRVWFGSVYESTKTGDEHRMSRRPVEIETPDWEPTEAERLEYEAQKIVVTASRQERRKAIVLKRPHDDLVRAVKLMRPFYKALSNFERQRLMEWFANECSKPKK